MISGGGTGGHIYPAISIAQALQELHQDVEILFVGAKGKMEMKKVPEAGFEIVGLWISGIQRSLSLQNLMFPFKVLSSITRSFGLIRKFKPDVVIGVGGYASGPLLYAASAKKIPTLIQEQNSYAGLTNKWLAGSVNKICVAHGGMEKYFPKDKLVVTGNPVRKTILLEEGKKHEGYGFFGLDPKKKTILIVGGSLGARSVNEFILSGYQRLADSPYQVIWQTGGYYFNEMKERSGDQAENILIKDFVREMHYAYAVADVVISRAGALSIAELMLTGKPSILVPSPNVAEDHQTVNARALVERDAAILVKDSDGQEQLLDAAFALLEDEERKAVLAKNIKNMSRPDAAKDIANEVVKLIA
ncbi:UDP-N-acetylglucosamine-N-acetylmuramylpentapeptide N-acetylglucosamine transferase [Marinoscillum furvescens DSM 4134]|uniref:UDP-N-acetylglucosamine--N-acetylmuramyl-(pentapeptide) pyrophosphoryl-undecaprenol N-acetylglucosamine transferase n=2 Tax=Marinoscillum furvescens TaxID=1026 RepID=A0A3D9KWD3_MARFU|nr:UDP-N-acetylglucosamine-N-acetylmuramylpentapeptide N-acetylglucosamine transferase [Marinoscillum furvescens DSM 4134]